MVTTAVGLVALVVLSIAIRIPFLAVPMHSDEGGYAYVARFWSSTYQLYRDIPFDRPQGIFLIYRFILDTLGHGVAAIRLGAAIYNAGTTVAVFLFARDFASVRSGWAAASLFAVFSASPRIEGFTGNGELFAILPLVVSAHLTWRERWGWAGLFAGLATIIKPIGVAGLLLTIGWAIVRRASWPAAGRTVLAFGLCPLMSCVHGYWIGWEHFWSSVTRMMLTVSVVASDRRLQLWRAITATVQTGSTWIVPGVLTSACLVRGPSRQRLFGILWLGASLAGMTIGASWFPHYFVQMLPPLAVLAGAGAFTLSTRWAVLAMLAVSAFAVRDAPLWFSSPKAISWELYHRGEYLMASEVAAYVAAHTEASDRIYVAFWQPEIYYLADRRAATPQLYWYEVTLSRTIFDQTIASIEARQPVVIVWINGPPIRWMSPERFEALLSGGYSEEVRLPYVRVYRRRPLRGPLQGEPARSR